MQRPTDLGSLELALAEPSCAARASLGQVQGDLLVLGAGGKMGPSLCRMAVRAMGAAGEERRVVAVARFSDPELRQALEADGVDTVAADLLDPQAVAALPEAGAVMFMAGTKFGTGGQQSLTWAQNCLLPGLVAERYAGVPTVVFSSGNVYPFSPPGPGADEDTPPAPIGEYAWSVLGRERIFEHFAQSRGTPVTIYRLNYATELRYGVPVDIARRVLAEEPIDLSMGHCNVIWQGDANAVALACLELAASPPAILNVTGPECLSVRELAQRFGREFGVEPRLVGEESGDALLSDSSRMCARYGPPRVGVDELLGWIAAWLRSGGPTHGKPTRYEVRDGAF